MHAHTGMHLLWRRLVLTGCGSRASALDNDGGSGVLEVVYYVACSVDGLIATPDGGLDWLTPFESSSEDYGYAAFYDSIDSVLVGSRTFEQSLTFGGWPYPGKPAWVFSARSTRDGS